jgi:crossover junction endodeoxyribonuclease RuvC
MLVRVLGIDPGLERAGFAVTEHSLGSLRALAFGTFRPVGTEASVRLAELRTGLAELIEVWRPDGMAVERLFVNQNRRTASRVGQAIGVALLVAAEQDIPVFEYTPSEVKRAVVGNGAATKAQVQYMVRAILGLGDQKLEPDAADALALAICHLHGHKLREAASR